MLKTGQNIIILNLKTGQIVMIMIEKTGQIVYCVIGGMNLCTEKSQLQLANGLKIQIRHY